MPNREHHNGEWERRDYEHDEPQSYGRERRGYGWERSEYERERERQGAGGYGRGSAEYLPERQPYSPVQQEWERQNWERRGLGLSRHEYGWGRPDDIRERERQGAGGYGYGREYRGEGWDRPDYERERIGSSWSPGWSTTPRPARDYGRERGGSPWGYRGDNREQEEHGWRQPGYESERDAFSGGLYAGRGPKGYQRSDERIREDICDRLTEHPAIDASEIEVEVRNCEVMLKGVVESRAVKHLAENMVETVPGVRDVHNQLRVTPSQQTAQGQTVPIQKLRPLT